MAELSDVVAANVEAVRTRISAAAADADRVRIVAVTKGHGPEAVEAAVAAGLTDIGENYAQELLAKAPAARGARLHFLGGVQRNKIGRLAPIVGLWQSVDRQEVGEAIARKSPGAEVLVQVDLTSGALEGRSGVPPAEVEPLLTGLSGLDLTVRGLMAVAPPPPADPAPGFFEVARLAASLGLTELSMGMSDDFEQAVAAGSTMVRLGRALLGPRPPKAGSDTARRVG